MHCQQGDLNSIEAMHKQSIKIFQDYGALALHCAAKYKHLQVV